MMGQSGEAPKPNLSIFLRACSAQATGDLESVLEGVKIMGNPLELVGDATVGAAISVWNEGKAGGGLFFSLARRRVLLWKMPTWLLIANTSISSRLLTTPCCRAVQSKQRFR